MSIDLTKEKKKSAFPLNHFKSVAIFVSVDELETDKQYIKCIREGEMSSSKSDYDMSYYDDDSMSIGLLYQKFHHRDIERLKWIIIVPFFFLSFQKCCSSNKNLINISCIATVLEKCE